MTGPVTTRWFVAIAIGWTWFFGFTAAALDGTAGRAAHLLALLGPLLAWLTVLLARSDGAERAAFLGRVLDVRQVRPAWWAAVVAVGAGLPLVAAGLAALAGGAPGIAPDVAAVGLLGVVGFALAAGLAEEPGWRGVAQDGAEPTAGRWRSAVALGVLWSLWHLPLYFVDGTYQHGLGVGTLEFWGSMLVRVPLAVLLVWLVAGTRGAIVAAVVAHALGNVVGELLTDDRTAVVLDLVLTTSAAVAVVLVCVGHGRRSGPVRQTAAGSSSHSATSACRASRSRPS